MTIKGGLSEEAIERQTNRRRCYICGVEFDEYNLKETHHMIPKGAGGSPSRDVPENKVDICQKCHKAIQPREGTQRTLEINREEDGWLWVKRLIDGEWVKQMPYGRLLTGEDVSIQLYESQTLTDKLIEQEKKYILWADEALKQQFYSLRDMGTVLFSEQCLIIHILAERRIGVQGDRKLGLKGAADFLGISYQTARLKHAVWQSIFKGMPRDQMWKELSPSYYYIAYGAKNKGIDPKKALDYAESKALSNTTYSPSKFREDVDHGLPSIEDEGGSILSRCPYGCKHYKEAPRSKLVLLEGDKVIATGSGEGQKYCSIRRLLLADIDTSRECKHFEERT